MSTLSQLIETAEHNPNFTTFQYLSCEPDLPLDFIEKYKDDLNWGLLTMYRKMPEWFMRKHIDKIRWEYVMFFQRPSDEFMVEMQIKGLI